MLQKKKYTTSTTRHANIIKIFDFVKLPFKIILKKNKKLNQSKKCFSHTVVNSSSSNNFKLNIASVVVNYSYKKKPYHILAVTKSVFNQQVMTPCMESLNIGYKIFNFTNNVLAKKPFFLGSQFLVSDVPYNMAVSSLSNNLNTKWTYIKSSGTYGLKIKGKKTIKLILIKMPSQIVYYFLKNVKCFIGKNYNFYNHKYVEGKWGFSIKRFKHISVRGVAMNPVDHPNGGRTKAKQPELSPWGWVAKRNK